MKGTKEHSFFCAQFLCPAYSGCKLTNLHYRLGLIWQLFSQLIDRVFKKKFNVKKSPSHISKLRAQSQLNP